jgi:hypothetical protein
LSQTTKALLLADVGRLLSVFGPGTAAARLGSALPAIGVAVEGGGRRLYSNRP